MIRNEKELDEALSSPSDKTVEMMKRLDGDIIILGVAGKMGLTLGRMAKIATEKAGVKRKITGVSRFSEPESKRKLEEWGIETVSCDLLDKKSVQSLPFSPNVIYMAGKKFGTSGAENITWAMNVTVPEYVAGHFKKSRITAFSTGCVYPLVSPENGGCTEKDAPAPVGEYSQSCLGRERVFSYFSQKNNTPVLLFRLNYAVDLRYGVLHDIAVKVWEGKPVSLSVSHFNVIWQGDANNLALRSLEHAAVPAVPLNITGPETVSLKNVAGKFGEIMGKEVIYEGKSGKKCYLNDASEAFRLFGYPEKTVSEMIEAQAQWIINGGKSLGKPTHFEVNNGKF